MTLLEKIKRELPGAKVEPAELNGHAAWRITVEGAGRFEALVYQDAASVQIRHLGAYQEARRAAPMVKAELIADP